MKVGISTACFYPYLNTEDTLDIIKDIGFDLCEVFLETEYETTREFCRTLRKKADSIGVGIYSVHAFSAGFEPYLFDRYPRRKSEMENKFRAICSCGSILGAECYVFHGLRKTMETADLDEIASGMDRLCSISGEYGIKLAWENVAWCRSSEPSFVKEVKNRMKEDIRFTIDIKQAIRSGKNPKEYLDIYGDSLINVHINDAGYGYTCLLPGKGEMDLKGIVKSVNGLNKDIPFIIELYRENYSTYEDLRVAKNYLEELGECD